jgi:hypothetical protein
MSDRFEPGWLRVAAVVAVVVGIVLAVGLFATISSVPT